MSGQLKNNRLTDATVGDQIDNKVAELETELAAILGLVLNADTATMFGANATGLFKILLKQGGADPDVQGEIRYNTRLKYHDGTVVQTVATSADIAAIPHPMGTARINANQSLPNDTWTLINWDGTTLNESSIVNLTTHKLVAPLAGKYLLTANGGFAASAAGNYRHFRAEKNNTGAIGSGTTIADIPVFLTASAIVAAVIAATVVLAVNDTISFFAIQDSGGALNFTAAESFAQMIYLGA